MPTEHEAPSQRGRSLSIVSLAQAAIAQDLEYAAEWASGDDILEAQEHASTLATAHSLAESYRRPSFAIAGNRSILAPFPQNIAYTLSAKEQEDVLNQERNLLRDNEIIYPKIGRSSSVDGQRGGFLPQPFRVSSFSNEIQSPHSTISNEVTSSNTNIASFPANVTTPLLQHGDRGSSEPDPDTIAQKWEEAVITGKIQTTWRREVKVLGGYCAPLMLTFLLQYSLTMASIFTVGRIGTAELGAVSLASMSANISGYAIYQGLSVSLDTLCAQAYGSGRKSLVGLQMQRMIFLLWLITIPIGAVWIMSDKILLKVVPEAEVAHLASRYLRVLLLGAPGYACFEAGKRFVQAQGIFSASLIVLCVCAPLNAFMNWLFVWHFGWGYVGAPIAVAITDNLLPLGLYIYVRFFSENGMKCWGGFTYQAFHNWTPMIKLAIPGLIMIEAEVLASEILTLMSTYFGVDYLAAQSVLATITALAFQVPFPLSVAASTRVANLIGATLGDAAKVSAKVALVGAVVVGGMNATLLSAFRWYIPKLFTDNEIVITLVARVLPVCAAFQLFDSLAACSNGVLRGLGRQEIGAYTQLICYYAIGIPFSVATAFGLKWHLYGLWTGNAIALGSVTVIEAILLYRISWSRAVEDAKLRNAMG